MVMELDYDYKSSSLRRIDLNGELAVEESGHKPQTGDVIAARVVDADSSYDEVDLPGGELKQLEEGDVVLGVFGNRAGVKGYIGTVPGKVSRGDRISFLGSGGIFGTYGSASREMEEPVKVEFLGYVSNGNEILNTKDYGVECSDQVVDDPCLVGVISTRMEAGKTTLASEIIERLSDRGYSVGSLKVTGSARERDRLNMLESGAEESLDFVDAGLPSTVDDSEEIVSSARGLVNRIWSSELDLVVIEFGAGLVSNYRVEEVMRDLDIKESMAAVAAVSIDVAGAFGLKKILGEMDYEMSFVAGPITDTSAGKKSIEEKVGVPALNAFEEDEMTEAVDLLESRIDSF